MLNPPRQGDERPSSLPTMSMEEWPPLPAARRPQSEGVQGRPPPRQTLQQWLSVGSKPPTRSAIGAKPQQQEKEYGIAEQTKSSEGILKSQVEEEAPQGALPVKRMDSEHVQQPVLLSDREDVKRIELPAKQAGVSERAEEEAAAKPGDFEGAQPTALPEKPDRIEQASMTSKQHGGFEEFQHLAPVPTDAERTDTPSSLRPEGSPIAEGKPRPAEQQPGQPPTTGWPTVGGEGQPTTFFEWPSPEEEPTLTSEAPEQEPHAQWPEMTQREETPGEEEESAWGQLRPTSPIESGKQWDVTEEAWAPARPLEPSTKAAGERAMAWPPQEEMLTEVNTLPAPFEFDRSRSWSEFGTEGLPATARGGDKSAILYELSTIQTGLEVMRVKIKTLDEAVERIRNHMTDTC